MTPTETSNIRKQLVRVAEHWAKQRGMKLDELLFRLRTAPLDCTDPQWNPIAGRSDLDDGGKRDS